MATTKARRPKNIDNTQPVNTSVGKGTGGSGYVANADPSIEWFNTQTFRPGSDAIRYSTRDPDATALMARCVGYAGICATLNAKTCASVPLRLYRRTRGKSNVDRKRNAWLRSPLDGYGPGKRAAQYADKSENVEEVTDHPAARIIEDPNGYQQGAVFWEYAYLCGQLAGNAYILLASESGRTEPTELLGMMPQFVRVIPDPNTFISGYTYSGLRQVAVSFDREDVIHFRQGQSPFNPYLGYSPMAMVLVEADLYQASNQFELAMWDNGAMPNMAVTPKDKLTEDQVKQLRAQWNSAYRGVGKAGGTVFLPYGMELKPLATMPKDMEWKEGRIEVRKAICNAFGVPESKIELNSANLASAQVGEVEYRRGTILPLLNRMAGVMTEELLPRFNLEPGEYWYAYDNPVPDDQLAETTRLTTFVASGIMTINEARMEQGLEPIDGGDRSLTAATLPPVDAPMVEGEPTVEPEGDADAPVPFDGPRASFVVDVLAKVIDGTLSAEAAKATLVSLAGVSDDEASAMVDAQVGQKEEVKADEHAAMDSELAAQSVAADEAEAKDVLSVDGGNGNREGGGVQEDEGTRGCCHSSVVSVSESRAAECVTLARRNAVDVPQEELSPSEQAERAIYRKCREFFAAQRDSIIYEMTVKPSGRQYAVPYTRGPIEDEAARLSKLWGIDAAKWTDRLTELLRGDVREAMVYGSSTAAKVVLENRPETEPLSAFGLDSSAAQGWLERGESQYLKDMAEINETTAKMLGETLAEGLANGEGVERLKERVKAAFDHEVDSGVTFSDYRAANVARTETFRANTYGQRATYDAYGVTRMRWLLSGDPCQFCIAFANQYATANAGESFAKKGTNLVGIDGGTMALDYENIEGPPLHPQCRCDMEPEID